MPLPLEALKNPAKRSNLKVAVNTIVPRSPFFAFCTPKSRPLQAKNKMRFKVCISEMALFEPYAAGTTVLPIDRHGFAEGFVSFRTLCVVCNRRWRDLLRIERLPGVRDSRRHRKRFCAQALRSPELSAQVKGSNSSTSYRQGYGKGGSGPPKPKF